MSTIGTLEHLNEEQLQAGVLAELSAWFGAGEVQSWKHLATYRIQFAQPNQVCPWIASKCNITKHARAGPMSGCEPQVR